MTIINTLIVSLFFLQNHTQFKTSPDEIIQCMKANCESQSIKCKKNPICYEGVKCVTDCPSPVTDECAIGCINSHIDLAMISFGTCAISHSCFSDAIFN